MLNRIMKKKEYKRPSVEVVELQQQCDILIGSAKGDVTATMNDTFMEEDI